MRVIDIENINYSMRDETQFVLHCEEVFHDKISSAAAKILNEKKRRPFVALSGPSGSGKTTTAMRLKLYLENLGAEVCLLSMDNFFFDSDKMPPEADDWESPYCVDRETLFSCIESLAAGCETQVPYFDFKTSSRAGYRPMQMSRDAIVIVEGIHMLNPLIFDKIRSKATGVYVAPRTRILTKDDRVVRPEQVRVARRLLRDYNNRGYSLKATVERAEVVNRGERNHITPNKVNASIHIDTFLDYELCILSKYLKELPVFYEELTPDFMDQHDLTELMNVVNHVPALNTPFVPKDSVIREFVGGSCFEY